MYIYVYIVHMYECRVLYIFYIIGKYEFTVNFIYAIGRTEIRGRLIFNRDLTNLNKHISAFDFR